MKIAFVVAGLLIVSFTGFAQGTLTFVTAAALPGAQTGTAYSQYVQAAGGTAPYTYALSGGALPAGLTMSTAGLISGTATASGPFSFTVTATDSVANTGNRTFSLTVTFTPLVIGTASPLPAGLTGVSYSQQVAAAGGIPPYAWSVTAGALPPGFTLSQAGVLAGLPAAIASYSFTVTIVDSASNTVSKPFTLSVSLGPLQITTLSPLPSTLTGTAYTATIAVQGGIPNYVWSLASGSLPTGLSFNSSTGVISGTPTAAGTATFTVTVFDSNFHAVSQQFTLTVGGSVVAISTPAQLPAATANVAYSAALTATGGVPPYTWSVVAGVLPPGLVISTGGIVSGIPTVTGNYVFSVQVQDSTALAASEPFGLAVAATGSVPRTGVIPHFVAGGGWTTAIWLVNRTAAQVQVSLIFHSDNGAVMNLPVTVTQGAVTSQVAASTLAEVIAPNTTLVVTNLTLANEVEGWVDVQGNGALSGFAFFSNGTAEASVPLQTQIGNSITLPFDNTGTNSTGIALVNLAGAQAAITATVWDQNGKQLASVPITLSGITGSPVLDPGGDGHGSFMLPAGLPVTAGIKGIVQFVGNPATSLFPAGQLAGLGLRADTTGLFTTLQTIVP